MTYTEKQYTIWMIRGQEDRRRRLHDERQLIMSGGGSTENKGVLLASLSECPYAVKLRIVDSALLSVGTDIPSESVRAALRRSIMLNICDRRRFPFERLNVAGVSRNAFYRYRNGFIEEVFGRCN